MNTGGTVVWRIRVSNARIRMERDRCKKQSTAIFQTIFRGFFSPLEFSPAPVKFYETPYLTPKSFVNPVVDSPKNSPLLPSFQLVQPDLVISKISIGAGWTHHDSRCNDRIASFSYTMTTPPTVTPHQWHAYELPKQHQKTQISQNSLQKCCLTTDNTQITYRAIQAKTSKLWNSKQPKTPPISHSCTSGPHYPTNLATILINLIQRNQLHPNHVASINSLAITLQSYPCMILLYYYSIIILHS